MFKRESEKNNCNLLMKFSLKLQTLQLTLTIWEMYLDVEIHIEYQISKVTMKSISKLLSTNNLQKILESILD